MTEAQFGIWCICIIGALIIWILYVNYKFNKDREKRKGKRYTTPITLPILREKDQTVGPYRLIETHSNSNEGIIVSAWEFPHGSIIQTETHHGSDIVITRNYVPGCQITTNSIGQTTLTHFPANNPLNQINPYGLN